MNIDIDKNERVKLSEYTKMELVERYYCKYCKRYFKTRRHSCMRDPKFKSCATCENVSFEYDDYRNISESFCLFFDERCRDIKWRTSGFIFRNVTMPRQRYSFIKDCPSWKQKKK